MKIIVLTISIMMSVLPKVQSQNAGSVTVTADPPIVCAGEPSNLHALYNPELLPVYDFEDGMQGWTTIDADGYGNAWSRTTSIGHNSLCCMRAQYNSAHDHNDFLVSPKVTLGAGKVSFYAKRSSSTWNDRFRVYLSTTNNTNASAFTIELTNGNVTPPSSFTKYEYDLSSYQGEGYVAIVYTAVADQGWLYIDDVSFNDDGPASLSGTTYGFENHTLQGWTTIDADGDGHNWNLGTVLMSGFYVSGFGDSEDMVVSQSYLKYSDGSGIPLFPDNYLVSPQKLAIQSGAFISFWACAQDATWQAEHFGVAISTTGKTNPNDFTTIQVWTLTAKSSGRVTDVSRGGNREQGNWYQYIVDLSEYVGQNIWVAIRHFNVTDMFYLDVDDITLYAGSASGSGDILYQWNNGLVGQNITVLPTQTTTYMVTAYKNGHNVGVGQQIVVVRPSSPNVTITTNTGETTICPGEEITLAALPESPPVFFTPGDILCTNGSVVKKEDWNSSISAKGVVFYVDATGQHGWAVDLGQIGKKAWSNENAVIAGLEKYSVWYDAISDMDGKKNTQIIRAFGNSSKYPAAWAVNYNDGWYLPSAGQLNVLFGELVAVNGSLVMVAGNNAKILTTGDNNEIWSSSVSTANTMSMTLLPKNGRIGFLNKNNSRYVRQIIDF